MTMAKKKRQNYVYGYKRQNPLILLLSATGFFLIFSRYLSTFPTYSRSYAGISWVLGLIGVVFMFARNYSAHIRILEVIYLDLITLFALIAFRSYSYIYPGKTLLCSIIIFGSCVLAYLIPIFNLPLAKYLRRELVAPETKFGKAIVVCAYLILPIGSTIASFFGMNSARQNDKFLLAIIGGSLMWAIALLLPFGTLHQISSFEKTE
jgi:hypothetical protein